MKGTSWRSEESEERKARVPSAQAPRWAWATPACSAVGVASVAPSVEGSGTDGEPTRETCVRSRPRPRCQKPQEAEGARINGRSRRPRLPTQAWLQTRRTPQAQVDVVLGPRQTAVPRRTIRGPRRTSHRVFGAKVDEARVPASRGQKEAPVDGTHPSSREGFRVEAPAEIRPIEEVLNAP